MKKPTLARIFTKMNSFGDCTIILSDHLEVSVAIKYIENPSVRNSRETKLTK